MYYLRPRHNIRFCDSITSFTHQLLLIFFHHLVLGPHSCYKAKNATKSTQYRTKQPTKALYIFLYTYYVFFLNHFACFPTCLYLYSISLLFVGVCRTNISFGANWDAKEHNTVVGMCCQTKFERWWNRSNLHLLKKNNRHEHCTPKQPLTRLGK